MKKSDNELVGQVFRGRPITADEIGWQEMEYADAREEDGSSDPLFYFMDCGIDIGFLYKGHKYWIESPVEELRGYDWDTYALSVCETVDPNWDGVGLSDKFLGYERHDAKNRRELCHYTGIDNFIEHAEVDGVNIREVLDNSFITDL